MDIKMALHTTSTTTTRPPTMKLNFHHKEPQINLLCCLNNNINIKDNKNNDKQDNNNNNNTTKKQLGCDIIVISLELYNTGCTAKQFWVFFKQTMLITMMSQPNYIEVLLL